LNLNARLTLAQAATMANVPPGTVRNWRYRGWLDAAGERHHLDARDGYRLGDVLRAERDTRRSDRSHRRLAA
jgi:hypothetical protein